MRARRHLVVMAKAPRLGRVKRRLAQGIGQRAAFAFYSRTLALLLRRLGHDGRWRLWLYVAPDRAVHRGCRWPRGLPRRRQGAGDLGARMRRPLRELPPGAVVIIGADIPDLARRHVAAAFRCLGSHDAVFGRAADGGYWLIGVRRRPHLPRLFYKVRWSTAHALADTLAAFDRRHRIGFLEELEDVDDAASYARFRERRAAALSRRA
ncbi:MAG TPA: TIGR04282 family arsenosugar biosynthesis glycosyltransferase [Alphaproteobacteria bacterium]|nr:TIGR04282 family arsenosugar biosynthesis glycosyltransferase [Alphaproteobacteria bacterium]